AWARVLGAGAVIAVLGVASDLLFEGTLAIGAGYRTLEWVTEPDHALGLVAALFVIRLLATSATIAGGGVGGLFIPLVIAGAILGDGMATVVRDETTLFPLIGVAAFLGAGYRAPLAGVVFVAETTGRPGFVVPGLIASVASQLVMGDVSVSAYQSSGRAGHLERRLQLPVGAALETDVLAAPADATLAEFEAHHLMMNRALEVPVVDDGRYVGMLTIEALREVPAEDRPNRTAAELADDTWPVGDLTWTLEQAVQSLSTAEVDTLVVVDRGRLAGVVTLAGIVRLDEILGSTHPETSAGGA